MKTWRIIVAVVVVLSLAGIAITSLYQTSEGRSSPVLLLIGIGILLASLWGGWKTLKERRSGEYVHREFGGWIYTVGWVLMGVAFIVLYYINP